MQYLALESNISDSKFAERTCCPTCRICDLKIKREEYEYHKQMEKAAEGFDCICFLRHTVRNMLAHLQEDSWQNPASQTRPL